MSVCMHIDGVTCENCNSSFTIAGADGKLHYVTIQSPPTYLCKHGVTQTVGLVTCGRCAQEAHARALLVESLDLLESDPELAARFRRALEKKP